MSVSFEWKGFDELLAAFQSLPKDLADEASPLAIDQATAAAFAIKGAWASHRRSGEMDQKLRVSALKAGAYARGATVIDSSEHALWFENGTAARHTKQGWDRGAMPPAHIFGPALARARSRFYGDVAQLLQAHGMDVR